MHKKNGNLEMEFLAKDYGENQEEYKYIMGDTVQKAIEEITYKSSIFPEEPFRVISGNRELAIPMLLSAVEKAVREGEDLEEAYQLHFYALFLLAQFQARECFSQIMELVTLPGDTLDDLIGDAVTSGLSDILYNTYNGDLELLKRAVENPEVNDYAKSGILEVMGQLYLDGDLGKEEFQEYIRQIVYEEEEIGEYVYTELASVICECHFVDMLPELRRLYDDMRVEEDAIGGYDSCIDWMFQYEKEAFCHSPVNAADMLRGWAMFEQPAREKGSEKDMEKLLRSVAARQNRPVPKVKIGRNDPCPCGSGKKYKHCCMNKPKSPIDLIESEEEKKKWLKDYPETAKERKKGRIYLEDLFDAESIGVDRLLYLALMYRAIPIWSREPEETVRNRRRVYLSEAFERFAKRVEREQLRTLHQYDEKYAIHYRCEEWLPALLNVLNKKEELYRRVSACYEKMRG